MSDKDQQLSDEEYRKEHGPWDGKRFDIKGLGGRDQYVLVDDIGLMVTFPDNLPENWNYQSTATALARMISIAIEAGVGIEQIKKQLRDSSMQENDTPHVLLQAMEKYDYTKTEIKKKL